MLYFFISNPLNISAKAWHIGNPCCHTKRIFLPLCWSNVLPRYARLLGCPCFVHGSGAANFENRAIFEVSCHVITNMPIFDFTWPIFDFTWPISDFTWHKNHVISNIAYFRIYMALWGHVNSNIHGRRAIYIRIYMAHKPCKIEFSFVFYSKSAHHGRRR